MSLLHTVINRFRTEQASKPNPSSLTPEAASLTVTDKRHLETLLAKRQLLEVHHPKSKQPMQTMILDINEDENYLLLDDLFPAPKDYIFKEGDVLQLRHHNEGHWLQFETQIRYKNTTSRTPFFATSMPKNIELKPRRSNDRVFLKNGELMTAKVISPLRKPWYAAIDNLSVGGVSLIIGGNALDHLSRDSIIPRCRIELAPGINFEAPVLVKHYRFQRKPLRQTYVCGQFMNLSPQQQRQLNNFIENLNDSTPVAA